MLLEGRYAVAEEMANLQEMVTVALTEVAGIEEGLKGVISKAPQANEQGAGGNLQGGDSCASREERMEGRVTEGSREVQEMAAHEVGGGVHFLQNSFAERDDDKEGTGGGGRGAGEGVEGGHEGAAGSVTQQRDLTDEIESLRAQVEREKVR